VRRRRLGNSDLEVSEISLGSWLTYGVGVERDRAEACVKRAFELDVNFFDTANAYGRGSAETFLGEALAGHDRSSYVLATKVFFAMSESDRGLSAAQIRKQLDASLSRLRTEYVDLYQCHRYDAETPLEETMAALTEAVRAGKVRYLGFSEWSPEQIQAAIDLVGSDGLEPFVSSQPQYSILYRRPERKVIPLCAANGISQIPWSPLAQGLLTGKYRPGQAPPADSRAASDVMGEMMFPHDDNTLVAVDRLRPIAEGLGISMAQLALAWVLHEPNVASAIIGATKPEQVEDNAAASGVDLSDDVVKAIDDAVSDVVQPRPAA
jgi:1-deoxyxylulose-5-phosphate synthase